MKKIISTVSSILIVVLAMTIVLSNAANAATITFPGVNENAYIEFVATKTIPVYRNSACSVRGTSNPDRSSNAEIWSGDKCQIISLNATYIQLKYPTASGVRTGYIRRSDLLSVSAPVEKVTSKSTGRITTFVNTSGKTYGYTEGGDTIYKLNTTGNYTAIIYTAKSGSRAWMYGYVLTSDYTSKIVGANTSTTVTNSGVTANQAKVVAEAKRWIGYSTLPGGTDGYYKCQAFVYQVVYRALGTSAVDYSRGTAKEAYYSWCMSNSRTNIPAGATVYFNLTSSGHVGIYVGDGMVVHMFSENGKGIVRMQSLDSISNYLGWGWQAGYKLN